MAFLAVLTLYLLVRPVPELAPDRTAEPTKKAPVTQSDSGGEDTEPGPKRTPSPSATPRPRTPTPAPVPAGMPAVLPDPGASGKATPDPLFPLLAPPPSAPPAPSEPAPMAFFNTANRSETG